MINRQHPAPKVNFSFGGLPAQSSAQSPAPLLAQVPNRVEHHPNLNQKHVPYDSYQPKIAPITPIQRQLPQNRKEINNISTKVTSPGSINSYGYDNKHHSFLSHHQNQNGSFQREGYGINRWNNDELYKRQIKVRNGEEDPHKDVKSKTQKAGRRKKGSKFCGPILWAILGFLLVALFFVAFLFMFGVFDLNGPYHPHQEFELSPAKIEGVTNHEDSVTIQTISLHKNGQDGTSSYQQSNKDYSRSQTDPIPQTFSEYTHLQRDNPVAINLRAYDDYDLEN